MGLVNLIKGPDRITLAEPQKHYVYKYKGEWHTKEELVSRTNKEGSWTDTSRNDTKYRRLTQENLWPRVSIDVELDIAAPIWEGYSITTNGVVLGIGNKEIGGKGQQVIVGPQELRENYFRSDLMWKAFIDSDYEPTDRRTWVAGIQRHEWNDFIHSSQVALDEIEIKTKDLDASAKEPKTKQGMNFKQVAYELNDSFDLVEETNGLTAFMILLAQYEEFGGELDWDHLDKFNNNREE